MNRQELDAFALVIIAGFGASAYPDMAGPGPNLAAARREAESVGAAMDALLQVAPQAGADVSESDYFQRNRQQAFWDVHYPWLAAVKPKYDPNGLFFVHHGVGSQAWSEDGFTRLI